MAEQQTDPGLLADANANAGAETAPRPPPAPVMPRTGVSSGHGKKECPSCHLLVANGTNTCPGCSYDFRGAREAARADAAAGAPRMGTRSRSRANAPTPDAGHAADDEEATLAASDDRDPAVVELKGRIARLRLRDGPRRPRRPGRRGAAVGPWGTGRRCGRAGAGGRRRRGAGRAADVRVARRRRRGRRRQYRGGRRRPRAGAVGATERPRSPSGPQEGDADHAVHGVQALSTPRPVHHDTVSHVTRRISTQAT